jgi:hypothetical protein
METTRGTRADGAARHEGLPASLPGRSAKNRRGQVGIYSLTSVAGYVLVVFMSAAAETPTRTIEPSRSGRLLDLVRKLIDYGRELAATIRQRSATDPTLTTIRFGTLDPVSILARIINGLLRASALEERVLRRAVHLDAGPRPTAARCAAATTPATPPAVPPPAAEPVDPRPPAHPGADRGPGAPSADRRRHRRHLPRFRHHGEPSAVAGRAAGHHQARRQPRPPGDRHHQPAMAPNCPAPDHGRPNHAATELAVRGARRHRAALNLPVDDRGVTHGASAGRPRRSDSPSKTSRGSHLSRVRDRVCPGLDPGRRAEPGGSICDGGTLTRRCRPLPQVGEVRPGWLYRSVSVGQSASAPPAQT